jgi:hypothetical protein
MQNQKGIVCSIVIICFLLVQLPTPALAKSFAADQGTAQVTHNAPQFKTTAPEPISAPASKTKGKTSTLWWGLAGLAAVVGLVAAVMSGGGGGSSNGDNGKTTETDTGSVTVEW